MLSGLYKRIRAIGLTAALIATIWLVSCVGGSNNASQPIQPNLFQQTQDQPGAGEAPSPSGGYPAFPGTNAALSTTRQASDAETTLNGNAFTEESQDDGNRPGETDPEAYVIAPGDNDDLAWVIYGIGGFSPDRPQGFQIEVTGVIAPGDNDDLPLSFWIGLSNYTEFSWEWLGPYSSPTSFDLNSETIRERYVSQADNFYFVVLTDSSDIEPSPENPQGISAVEITSTTTFAIDVNSPEYYPTAPHYPTEPSAGAGGSKEGSALDPATQYVTVSWTHLTDSASSENEASGYRVLRQRIGGTGGVALLNTVGQSTTSFTDPTDTNPALDGPVPGETYAYYVQAQNAGGLTRFAHAGQQHIPLFAPTSLRASDGAFTDKIHLLWDKAEGAVGYQVFRDSQDNRIAVIDDAAGWADTTVGDFVDHTYWVRPRNKYATVGPFSDPATGHMNGAPVAALTIGNGQESGTWPHLVEFNASASFDPDGTAPANGIVEFEWDFDGDGNYDDSGQEPTGVHEYDQVFGDFNATVRVTDGDGATATASVLIHVNDPPSAVLAAEPTGGPPGLEVTFNATGSTDQDDGIADYEWDFDGDGIYNEMSSDEEFWRGDPNPTTTYFDYGVFLASVRVTDNSGATDTNEIMIEIL